MSAPTFVAAANGTIYGTSISFAAGVSDIVLSHLRVNGGATPTMTYDGNAMTEIGTRNEVQSVFRYQPTVAGSVSLVPTHSGELRGIQALSYVGINTATPIGNTAAKTSESSSPNIDAISATENDVVLVFIRWNGFTTLANNTGTQRATITEDNHNLRIIELPGSPSVSWSGTLSGSSFWWTRAVVLQGAAASAPSAATLAHLLNN